MTRQERIAAMEAVLKKAQDEKRVFTEAEGAEFDGHRQTIARDDEAATVADLDTQRRAMRTPKGALRPVGRAPAIHAGGERKFSLRNVMRSLSGDHGVDIG